MIVEHRGATPQVDPSAYVAPNAVLCGDVRIGPDARILFGAVVTAEDGSVTIGARCVVMENALVRARAKHPVILGDDVLVGPHAHVNGAVVGEGSFIATGASLFPGVVLGRGVEVRINGVVHVNSTLADGKVVPIGWIAVGHPAKILPPENHRGIWAIQKQLDFPGTVYGLDRSASARERMERQSAWFGAHRDDRVL
jgi:carbonic anhydrase/acetyltransferase-like protein (isoleucine patch superfamily)